MKMGKKYLEKTLIENPYLNWIIPYFSCLTTIKRKQKRNLGFKIKIKYIFIKTMDNKVQNFQSIICHLSFTGKYNGHFELSFQFWDVIVFFKHKLVHKIWF